MNLTRLYLRMWSIPTIVLLAGHALYLAYDHNWGPGSHYKSEWLRDDSFDGLILLGVFLNGLLYGVLMTPVLLLKRENIRSNPFAKITCWFMLPCIMIGVAWHKTGLFHHVDKWNVFTLVNTLPYLLALLIGFRAFTRSEQQVI